LFVDVLVSFVFTALVVESSESLKRGKGLGGVSAATDLWSIASSASSSSSMANESSSLSKVFNFLAPSPVLYSVSSVAAIPMHEQEKENSYFYCAVKREVVTFITKQKFICIEGVCIVLVL
jgi:hypothetical protein